jgi:MerR family transcriptional regulator/heat shock protein HspR
MILENITYSNKILDMENMETPLFPISIAARILNISVHTLRMYEKEGLIVPFKKESSHRLYSKADIERIICIRKAINQSKISINGIKTIYSLIPCWEIMSCTEIDKGNCDAFKSHSNPCWTFHHANNKCASNECRECSVYKNFGECKNLKDKLISLIK